MLQLARMNCLNVIEAQKIRQIQRQDAGQAISLHDCGKPGIVDLNAANLIGQNQPAPYQVNLLVVR